MNPTHLVLLSLTGAFAGVFFLYEKSRLGRCLALVILALVILALTALS